MRAFPPRLLTIPGREFGHGRTRNLLAREARGEVLLYLSQDAVPAGRHWLATLAATLVEPNVAGAYARQLPCPDAHPFSRFFLERTYGPKPARRSAPHTASVRIHDMFFSNVSSAIRREVWQRLPFRDDVIMSEDQYWAYDALRAGYDVVYQPAAAVYHSHDYSLPALFRRNRASGASLRGLIADTPRDIAGRGLAYIAAEAAYVLHTGQARWLPYLPLYEAAKALGFALGSAGVGRHANRVSQRPDPAA